jgi:hypothetical protein
MSIEDYAPFSLADLAREWTLDVVANPEDVEDASDAEVMDYVRKHYEGGVIGFAADAYADCGYGTLAATLRDTSRAY